MWYIPLHKEVTLLAGKKYVITIKEAKSCRWWIKICCFLFGCWLEPCPDGSGNKFCSRGCGK